MDDKQKQIIEEATAVQAIQTLNSVSTAMSFVMSQATIFLAMRLSECRTMEDFQKLTADMRKAIPQPPETRESPSE